MFNLFNVITSSNYEGHEIYLEILSIISIFFGVLVINSKNPIVSVLFLIGLFISISLNLILLGYNFIGLSYLLVYVGAVSILFLFILMLINIRISELLNDSSNSIPLAIFTGFSLGFPIYFILNNMDFFFALSNKRASHASQENKSSFDYNHMYDFFAKHDLLENSFILEDSLPINLTSNSILEFKTQLSWCLEGKKDIFTSDAFAALQKDAELYYVSSNSWNNNLINFNDITGIGNILYSTYGIWLIICSIILLLAMIGAITITKKEKD